MLEAWISDSNVLHCITAQENTSDNNIVDISHTSFIQFQEIMITDQLLLLQYVLCFSHFYRK